MGTLFLVIVSFACGVAATVMWAVLDPQIKRTPTDPDKKDPFKTW